MRFSRLITFVTIFTLSACANQGQAPEVKNVSALPADKEVAAPVALAPGKQASQQAKADQQATPSVVMALEEAAIKKAIFRYEVATGTKGGTVKAAGADLNGDGVAEMLVTFTGDEWCSFAGCRLVIFRKTEFGYRTMRTIKNADAPVWVTQEESSGWRHLIVKTGSAGNRRDVTLRFDNNYPADAANITKPNSDIPIGEVIIDADYSKGSPRALSSN